jgi:hypothetical protein
LHSHPPTITNNSPQRRPTPTNRPHSSDITTMLRTITPTLALLLVIALCRAQSTTTFVCPSEGKFPDPEDCFNYITCVSNGDTLEATVKTCVLGLEWNDDKKDCDFEDESTCEL